MGMLQIIDEATSAVLFDFDDPTGAANPSGLKTRIDDLDIGEVESEEATFAADRPGIQVVSRIPRQATMTWIMRVDPYTSVDAGIAGVRQLGWYLDAGGVMKYLPDGATVTKYMDYLPASTRPLIRGQPRGLLKILKLLQDPDGADFEVRRQPHLRGDERAASVNRLANATLLLDTSGDGVPDGWTLLGAPATPPSSPGIDTADEAFEFTADAAGEGYYQQLAATPGQVWTAQVETAVLSGTRDVRLLLSFRDATTELAATPVDSTSATYGRRTVTSAAAPAGTTLVRVSLLSGTAGSGSGVLGFRRAQLELAAAASSFRTGVSTMTIDPSV